MISCRPISDLSYVRCPYWGILPFWMRFMDLGGVVRLFPFTRRTSRRWSIHYLYDDSSVEPLGSYPIRLALLDASMSSCFPSGRCPFDLWVWFSCRRGWLGSRIRWRVIWAHLVLLTHHALCWIALMWAVLGIDSRAFWLWWTGSYGMSLHWGIAIS